MSYVVLARKWRPQSFEDLVGQEHVSTTLGNAIARDRVAHAFLFTGVRGVGKTTSARILAKALNCVQGPTATPCQTCSPCKEITAGRDLDVQEIDGASYNGVDEVRKLQGSLGPQPSRDRFKIFIVDEVHMLSNAAWNAFLKTLEEPPPHVKFIFATTEVHKVPVTILSRCQRYDFKLVGAQAIAARLRWVVEQENIPADDAALTALAREAAGSVRDAMSLLDQVIAWVGTSGDRITAEGVARVLGVADRVVLHRLADAVVDGDPAACVRIVGELAQQGYDLPHVARDFLAHLRDLVVAKVCEDPAPLLELADAEVADVRALAAKADADDLTRLHQGFSRAFDDIVRSGQPRASLEMALVRLARRPPLLPLDELLRRLGDLERRIHGGGGGAPQGGAPERTPQRPGGNAPQRRGVAPAEDDRRPAEPAAPEAKQTVSGEDPPQAPALRAAESTENRLDATSPPLASEAPAAEPPVTPAAAQPPSSAPPREAASAPVRPREAASAPVRPGATPPALGSARSPSSPPNGAVLNRPANGAAPPSRTNGFAPPSSFLVAPSAPVNGAGHAGPSNGAGHAGPSNGAGRAGPSNGAGRAGPSNGAATVSAADVAVWRAVLALVQRQRPPLASVLEHACVLELSSARAVLGYDDNSFLVAQATEPAARELLAGALRAHFRAPVEVVFETVARGSGAPSVVQIDGAERKARVDAARRAVAEHPLVTAAIELLGAELKDVRLGQDATEG